MILSLKFKQIALNATFPAFWAHDLAVLLILFYCRSVCVFVQYAGDLILPRL